MNIFLPKLWYNIYTILLKVFPFEKFYEIHAAKGLWL